MPNNSREINHFIFTRQWDDHAVALSARLNQLGVYTSVINWTNFPSLASATLEMNIKDISMKISNNKRYNTLNTRNSCYIVRKLPILGLLPQHNNHDNNFCSRESTSFILGFYAIFSRFGHWINPPIEGWLAGSKPLQLHLAAQLGLHTPPTLFTNNPDDVQEFVKQYSGGVVVKSFTHALWIKSKKIFYPTLTTQISKNDIKRFYNNIKTCPSIYQVKIPKKFDIRTVVIENNLYSAKIISKKLDDNKEYTDWKEIYYKYQNVQIEPIKLNKNIVEACINLVKMLNLDIAVIDLCMSKDNKIYFLEVNPYGQWLWMDIISEEFPLLDCFAKYILSTKSGIFAIEKEYMPFSSYMSKEYLKKIVVDTFHGDPEEKILVFYE